MSKLPEITLPGDFELLAFFNFEPRGKPRETRKDRWNPKPSVVKYRGFRDRIRLTANTLSLDSINYPKKDTWLIFLMPMPKSWSEPKKRDHNLRGKASTPDVDNLCKGFLDAMFYKQPIDDRTIWDTRITKLWSYQAGLIVAHDPQPWDQLREALDPLSQPPE